MRIGIISPSGPSSNTALHRRQLKQGMRALESLGFMPVLSEHAESFQSYYADTPEARVADLHAMYADSSIDAVFAANGGWPASHMLRLLNYHLIRENPKPLLGYSDISVLLNAIQVVAGVQTIHGPLVTWGIHDMSDETRLSLCQALCRQVQLVSLHKRSTWIVPGSASGRIVAGNLVTLQTLLGTPFEPKWEGAILFWEEDNEATWTIDRALTHLENAGVYEKLSGMVIGQISGTNEKWEGRYPAPLDRMLDQRLGRAPFPVLRTPLFGHGGEPNLSIPVGGYARMNEMMLRLSFEQEERLER